MAWTIKFDARAKKELKKLGSVAAKDILNYLAERIAPCDDPRAFGAALRFDLAGLWKYRVGNYRVVCNIEEESITVLVVHVGHRRDVYE